MSRRGLWCCLLISSACSGGAKDATDAGAPATFHVETGADEKALLYNLVGRWYPEDEIKRLSDRTLTPEQWCEREPETVFVYPEKIEVRCRSGAPHAAMISEVKREGDGTIAITFRAKENSKLKQLRIHATGPKAMIAGSPCSDQAAPHARFPEYEILSREILAARRCAQVIEHEESSVPEPVVTEP